MKKELTLEDKVILKLGMVAHLISWSKSGYHDKYPDNNVIFNANVCIKQGLLRRPTKIWYGDLDVSVSHKNLVELAKELNTSLYVLYEMDGRFENDEIPLISRYVYKITPQGKITVSEDSAKYITLKLDELKG